METPLLDRISSPSDLKGLSNEELKQLCVELRETLIETVSKVGGHFASSLGVVELTAAVHKVFDTPRDRLIWDVGHQAYIHKILTGRRHELAYVRQFGGISGFPRRIESCYDSFGVGHAGTSISAASGMLEGLSQKNQNGSTPRVVAIIGDGAMTAGMAFEALNHSGQLRRNLVVILNDNEMSIAPNVGALSRAFSKRLTNTLTTRFATKFRRHFKNLVEIGVIPSRVYRALDRAEDATLGFFSSPAMLFESFGYRYIGPIDGHDLDQIIDALERAKQQDCPVIVHALTIKGKGYKPAERDPIAYHGVDPFSIKGKPIKKEKKLPSFTQVFGRTLVELARDNPAIVGITAAMPDGTGLRKLADEMPDRYYDVGIAEQHAVTFSAGLACEGVRPFCAIYSSFLQRAYDQILHDVCIQSLPVVFAIDRAGLVGPDGATHHGAFDIAFLRNLPNMVLMAPKDGNELRDMMLTAAKYGTGPIAIRYPKGPALTVDFRRKPQEMGIGQGEILRRSGDARRRCLIIGVGTLAQSALDASLILSSKGIEATVFNPRFLKPLDEETLHSLIQSHSLVITVEDHVLQGGFGSAVLEFMSEQGLSASRTVVRLGIPDQFIEHGQNDQLYRLCGIDVDSIVKAAEEAFAFQNILKPPFAIHA